MSHKYVSTLKDNTPSGVNTPYVTSTKCNESNYIIRLSICKYYIQKLKTEHNRLSRTTTKKTQRINEELGRDRERAGKHRSSIQNNMFSIQTNVLREHFYTSPSRMVISIDKYFNAHN